MVHYLKIDDVTPMPGTDPHNPRAVDNKLVGARKENRSWPFKDMKVGEHTLIPFSDWKRAQFIIHNRRYLGVQDFVWRKSDDGVHVWCTKNTAQSEAPTERIRWGFAAFKVGDARAYPIALKAKMQLAARQVEHRLGYKFEFKHNAVGCAVRRVA